MALILINDILTTFGTVPQNNAKSSYISKQIPQSILHAYRAVVALSLELPNYSLQTSFAEWSRLAEIKTLISKYSKLNIQIHSLKIFELLFSGYAFEFIDREQTNDIPYDIARIAYNYQNWIWDMEKSHPSLDFGVNGTVINNRPILDEDGWTWIHYPAFSAFDIDKSTNRVSKWIIEIPTKNYAVSVGIVDRNYSFDPTDEKAIFYYSTYGYAYVGDKKCHAGNFHHGYGYSKSKGDIIETILDMNNYTLSFVHTKNMKRGRVKHDLGIAFRVDQNRKYRFVVSSGLQHATWKMLN